MCCCRISADLTVARSDQKVIERKARHCEEEEIRAGVKTGRAGGWPIIAVLAFDNAEEESRRTADRED